MSLARFVPNRWPHFEQICEERAGMTNSTRIPYSAVLYSICSRSSRNAQLCIWRFNWSSWGPFAREYGSYSDDRGRDAFHTDSTDEFGRGCGDSNGFERSRDSETPVANDRGSDRH